MRRLKTWHRACVLSILGQRKTSNSEHKEAAMFAAGVLILIGAMVSLYVSVDFLRPVPRTSPF
jgi:hypothetical protein